MNKQAYYTMVDKDGFWEAETTCEWTRVYGNCNRQTHRRHNTIYTVESLVSWGRRNGVDIEPEDYQRMKNNTK